MKETRLRDLSIEKVVDYSLKTDGRWASMYVTSLFLENPLVVAYHKSVTGETIILLRKPKSYLGLYVPAFDRGYWLDDPKAAYSCYNPTKYIRKMMGHGRKLKDNKLYEIFRPAKHKNQKLWNEFEKKIIEREI